jgi:hypothetical protein
MNIPVRAMGETHWIEADRAAFTTAWKAELAQVPEFTDSILHMVTGLLLPIWKRLPQDSSRVYRLQTDEGERIIGRRVSPAWAALPAARRNCRNGLRRTRRPSAAIICPQVAAKGDTGWSAILPVRLGAASMSACSKPSAAQSATGSMPLPANMAIWSISSASTSAMAVCQRPLTRPNGSSVAAAIGLDDGLERTAIKPSPSPHEQVRQLLPDDLFTASKQLDRLIGGNLSAFRGVSSRIHDLSALRFHPRCLLPARMRMTVPGTLRAAFPALIAAVTNA